MDVKGGPKYFNEGQQPVYFIRNAPYKEQAFKWKIKEYKPSKLKNKESNTKNQGCQCNQQTTFHVHWPLALADFPTHNINYAHLHWLLKFFT